MGNGKVLLKQSHQDGGRDIVGQIRHYLEGSLAHQSRNIRLQYITRHNAHISVTLQRFRQHRRQFLVQLHSRDLRPRLGKSLGQGANAGANLQYLVPRLHCGSLHDAAHNAGINQEVLPQSLAGMQAKCFQDVLSDLAARYLRVECLFFLPVHLSSLSSCATACSNSSRVMP